MKQIVQIFWVEISIEDVFLYWRACNQGYCIQELAIGWIHCEKDNL